MPFSETSKEHTEQYWTDHYEKFLKPTIKSVEGIHAHRSTPMRGDLLRGIITDLVKSDIVVADITDRNPNVFWELGVRQSFKHGTIVIQEHGQKLPFDISVKAALDYYPNDHTKNEEFKRTLIAAIEDICKFPKKADSHVLETLDGRGTIYEIISREEKYRKLIALRNEVEMNLNHHQSIRGIVEDNVKNRKARIPLVSIERKAIELLYVSRYFESDEISYADVQYYFTIANQLSFYIDRLRVDPNSSLDFHNYLLSNGNGFASACERLLSQLYSIESKLRKQA